MSKILPSILISPWLDLKENINRLNNLGIDELHLDVMDGIFVPNITFGDKLVYDIHKEFPTLKLDVHLMTKLPEKKIEQYILAGATTITFHIEETNVFKLKKISKILNEKNINLGLAVGYDTNIKKCYKFLKNKNINVDQVLIMSVKEGKGGQKFDETSLNKVRKLIELRDKYNKKYEIEIDGGINSDNYKIVKLEGVTRIVIGNSIFKENKIEENYKMFTN